jgi:hypothetical protein
VVLPSAARADPFCAGITGELTNALVLAAKLAGSISLNFLKADEWR